MTYFNCFNIATVDHGNSDMKQKDTTRSDEKVEASQPYIDMQIALKMGRLALELTKDPEPG